MNTRCKPILALACMLVLSACSMLVGKHEDLTVYAPRFARAETAAPAAAVSRRWQLSVFEPRAISPLDGSHIAVMPAAGELQTYKGARWRDTAPVMIQQLLLEAFQDAGLGGTGDPANVLHADFALQSTLQDFQAEYRGAKIPIVVMRLQMQLVDNGTGRTLASRAFAIEQTCAGAGVPEVFAAFQAALDQLLQQVVAWTITTADGGWKDPRPAAG